MTTIIVDMAPYYRQGKFKLGQHTLTEWYEAHASDELGTDYQVVWKISYEYRTGEETDENKACDWANPWAVVDEVEVEVLPEGSYTIEFDIEE